jgi:hypothetical protein
MFLWNWLYRFKVKYFLTKTMGAKDIDKVKCQIRWHRCGILVRNNQMNQKANSVDPDQMARMFQLIWI